jgi:hypothetical protein
MIAVNFLGTTRERTPRVTSRDDEEPRMMRVR